MCDIYRIFANDWKDCLNFSDEMLIELFNHESYGTHVSNKNGFLWGKKWLNVNVTMWKEDIRRGFLVKSELYEDERYPIWWLDNVL